MAEIEKILANARVQKHRPAKRNGHIYFLVKNSRIVYVGQTVELDRRIRCHRLNPQMRFDDAYYFICELPDLLATEDSLIATIKPDRNSHNLGYRMRRFNVKLLEEYGFGHLAENIKVEK